MCYVSNPQYLKIKFCATLPPLILWLQAREPKTTCPWADLPPENVCVWLNTLSKVRMNLLMILWFCIHFFFIKMDCISFLSLSVCLSVCLMYVSLWIARLSLTYSYSYWASRRLPSNGVFETIKNNPSPWRGP